MKENEQSIAPYLHLYLGCRAVTSSTNYDRKIPGTLVNINIVKAQAEIKAYGGSYLCTINEVVPILNRLSDMTEEDHRWWFKSIANPKEQFDFAEWVTELNGHKCEPHWTLWVKNGSIKHGYTVGINNHFKTEQFVWFLQNGYWIFSDEAFDKGLIIDAKTIER